MRLSSLLSKIEDRLEQAVSITLGEPYSEIEVYNVDARTSNVIKVEFRVIGCQRRYEWTFDLKSLTEDNGSAHRIRSSTFGGHGDGHGDKR